LCRFFGFCRLGCQFKPDLGHDLGIEFLQSGSQGLWMIAIVQQDGDLWNIDRLGAKIIEVVTQHFEQALVIGDIGFSAMSEKRKTQCIHRQMSFDAIGAFVQAEALGLDTGVAGILYRLGINEQQGCPLGFFFTCSRTCPCNRCIRATIALASRHCL